jgi:hypothetical protein
MRNLNDPEDDNDYNLVSLSQSDPKKYEEVVRSNLREGDTVSEWENSNRRWAQSGLRRNYDPDFPD